MSVSVAVEIPTVFAEWSTVQWPRRHDTDIEALMSARPFFEPEDSVLAIEALRAAVIDCFDQLCPEDQFILEALWFERTTVRSLAVRLGRSKSRTWEVADQAMHRLGALCAEHPVIAARVA